MRLILYIFIFLKVILGDENACLKQDFGHSSFVCVCNSTYCDSYGKIERKLSELLPIYQELSFVTSATSELTGFVSDCASSRLQKYQVNWQVNSTETVGATIRLDR